HAPTEPTGCIAKPEGNGRITVYSNTQALYFTLDNMAMILGVPFNKLRLVGGTVGGGFGGKVDVIVEPIAALGAMLTNRPVKYAYSRAEEMQVSSPRDAERLYIKDGVMKDGRLLARKIPLRSGVPVNKVRLVGGTVGGGFGGKVDVIVEPIAALGAMLTNRPVKYAYSRAEEMQVSSPRAAERLYIKDGVMKDGRIVARKITL